MHITKIILTNVRGFATLKLDISKSINVLVGVNNSGKSTILNAIYNIQNPNVLTSEDIRIGSSVSSIQLLVDGKDTHPYLIRNPPLSILKKFNINELTLSEGGSSETQPLIPMEEPNNFIYPYLSNRKVVNYTETLNQQTTNQVSGDLGALFPKINRLINPEYPGHQEFVDWCKVIFGLSFSTMPSQGGIRAGYMVDRNKQIPIQAMGAGIPNALGLLVDLCAEDGHLFLIEEIENDLHPASLRALLKLIIKKSDSNQFILTTHSNIVTNVLGAHDNSNVIQVKVDYSSKVPLSTAEIADTYESRLTILEELGYQFTDTNPWSYWLLLEESTAERIIRDYIIPMFVPDLKYKLRTFSAVSLSQVPIKFEDFNRLFVFLNLQKGYKNRAWIIVDEGDDELEVINSLKEKYSKNDWDEDRFLQFDKHNFEEYYPDSFQDRVKKVLLIENNKDKRNQKLALFNDVKKWLDSDKNAMGSLEKSAAPVIELLRVISESIKTEESL